MVLCHRAAPCRIDSADHKVDWSNIYILDVVSNPLVIILVRNPDDTFNAAAVPQQSRYNR